MERSIGCSGKELYDLTFDPKERRNLASDPSCAKDLAEMRAKLATWMKAPTILCCAVPFLCLTAPLENDMNGISPERQTGQILSAMALWLLLLGRR